MKILLRVLALPFFLGIHTIFTIGFLIRNAKDFLMYGGESIIHRKDDQLTVHGMLVEMRNSRMQNEPE